MRICVCLGLTDAHPVQNSCPLLHVLRKRLPTIPFGLLQSVFVTPECLPGGPQVPANRSYINELKTHTHTETYTNPNCISNTHTG